MCLRDVSKDIYSDYRRYRATGVKGLFQVVFLSQGFWASFIYRLSHQAKVGIKNLFIRRGVRFFSIIAQKGIEILTGIGLSAGCRIGRGLYIGHFGHIGVHSEAQMGDNCNLSQGVTIGILSRGKRKGVPKIGNRVFIGPNAVILGDITVGNDSAIGPGAVVTKSIPPLAVVVGNPAQIISYKGSFEYVQFDDMDNDPERLAALKQREKIKEQTGSDGS